MRNKDVISVGFYIKKNQINRDGKYTLYVRINKPGDKHKLVWATDISVPDPFLKSPRNRKYLIQQEQLKSKILYVADELYSYFSDVSLEQVKSKFIKNEVYVKPDSLMSFFDRFVSAKLSAYNNGNLSKARIWTIQYSRRLFTAFLSTVYGIDDLDLSSLSSSLILGYQNYLMEEVGLKKSTSQLHLIILSSVLKIIRKRHTLPNNLFSEVSLIIKSSNKIKYLTEDELNKLINLRDNPTTIKPLTRYVLDIFLFSCYTGLSFIDILTITPIEIIKEDNYLWIYKNRKKTNSILKVFLVAPAIKILNEYKLKSVDNVLFRRISNNTANNQLERIMKLCDIATPHTFHSGRHTFATLSLTKGVSLETVSAVLGHTNINTTRIYAKVIATKVKSELIAFQNKLTLNIF